VLISTFGITAVHSLDEWIPCLPPWPDEVRLEAISIEENAYVEVEITFPHAGYDVDWGSLTRTDNLTFSADAKIWVWTGASAQVITTKSHTYDLGALSPGAHRFIFNAWDTPIKSLQFVHRLTATFKLETLYILGLDADLQLYEGSKLVDKFYTYAGVYNNESVAWTGTTPDNVSFSITVPHPQGKPVERVELVLTDNEDNVIFTIASWTATKSVLFARYLEIIGKYSKPGPDKPALFGEYLNIIAQYARAPF
jgi:hypothetical protein